MQNSRLDSFTDAAFAFAVSLMVIGGSRAPGDFNELTKALGDLPAFAVGFALMALFWMSHVRWRRIRGEGDWKSTLLTLLLVFLTLVYVQPLRAMAAATGLFFTGQGEAFRGSLAGLFAVYGTGFVAMALTMAALWSDATAAEVEREEHRFEARHERNIWLIIAATGLVSILLSLTRFGAWAAMAYATLPITVGLYSWRLTRAGADGSSE